MSRGIITLCLMILHFVAGDEFHFDPHSDHSKEHLKEDLEGVIDKDIHQMNADELQFHYFRQHDYDNNDKLDGTELMVKLFQDHADQVKKQGSTWSTALPDEYIYNKIDSFLKSNDLNKDGYIEYAEYIKGSKLAR